MILRYVKMKADWWTNVAHYNREVHAGRAGQPLPACEVVGGMAASYLPIPAIPGLQSWPPRRVVLTPRHAPLLPNFRPAAHPSRRHRGQDCVPQEPGPLDAPVPQG